MCAKGPRTPLRAAQANGEPVGDPINLWGRISLPLGDACRHRDYDRAAHIITSIRAAARTGLSFSSPHTTAYYLHYQAQIPTDILETAEPEPLATIIQAELDREAVET